MIDLKGSCSRAARGPQSSSKATAGEPQSSSKATAGEPQGDPQGDRGLNAVIVRLFLSSTVSDSQVFLSVSNEGKCNKLAPCGHTIIIK